MANWTENDLSEKQKAMINGDNIGNLIVPKSAVHDNNWNHIMMAAHKFGLEQKIAFYKNNVLTTPHKRRFQIGIDPDVDKSGLAVWDSQEKKLIFLADYRYPDLMERIKELSEMCEYDSDWIWGEYSIKVEAGWFNKKSNFHGAKNNAIASRIGAKVGANHQVGKLIVEHCLHYGIEAVGVWPLRKMWGKSGKGKITGKEFKMIFGDHGKTSQEMRDAALIAVEAIG